MKITSLLILLICTSTLLAQQNSQKHLVKLGVGLDNLKFGETKARMIEELGRPDDSLLFMGCTCYYSYFDKGIAVGIYNTNQIIQIILNNDVATSPLNTKFTPFKGNLKEGITLNSSWADVEKTYGKPDVINEVENQDSPALQAIYNDKSLSFLVAKDYSKILYILAGAKEKK